MGGGSWTRNKRINDAVATRAALRPSPSAVQGANISPLSSTEFKMVDITDSSGKVIGQSRQPIVTGGREAKFYSEMSAAEKKAVDDIESGKAPSLNLNTYGGIVAPTYSSGRTYDSPDQALAGLGSFLGNIDKSVKQTASKINYNQFDPGDFARAGYSGPSSVSNRAATEATAEYITKNKIPLSIEKDGQTLYLTTGLSEDVLARTLGDDYKASGSYEAYGPVGTYSTVYQKPQSVLSSINPVVRAALGVATGGLSEGFITGAKAISGETLHGGDYLSLAVPALQKSGMLVPPEAGATGAAAAGKGIANLGYADSVGLLSAAATGDPTSFIVGKFGNEALDKAFKEIPVDSDLLGRFQADDVKAGMVKVVDKLAGGADFDEALVAGLGKYVREGGGLNLDGVDVDLGVVEDIAKALTKQLEPALDALSAVDTAVRQGLSEFDKEVLQPAGSKAIGDVLSSADTAVRQSLSEFDDKVLQPITQPVGDVIEDVGQAIGDAFSGLNVPNFNPNLGQFGLQFTRVSDTGEPATQPSSTRTTDALFGDELFKFKTPIEDTQERLDYIDLNSPFDQSQELELELTYPDSTEESEGFFEGTIYEQQPRSYNF
jgi:hypothetical protein